jgi:hypothetical protein
MDVRVDPGARRLYVTGSVRLPAADSARVVIPVVLDRMMRELRVDVVEPAGTAGPATLDSTGLAGRDVRWSVRPRAPLPARQEVTLRFSYAGGEPVPTFLFFLGGEVLYASGWGTNWYPGVGDGTTKAVGALRIHVPPTFTTVLAGAGRRTGTDTAGGWWAFDVATPTYFSFVAGPFVATRRPGPVPVTVYTIGPNPGAAAQADAAARAMAVLQREFGPYRFGELGVVEYPDTLARRLGFNAAGEPGLLVLKGGFLRGAPSLPNYGHELAHNWWPNVAGFRRPEELLSEAIANYGAFRVVEAVAGADAAERFRWTGDPGFNGDVNAWYYLRHAAAGFDTALVDFREGTFPGRNMGGVKGAFVFDMLAQEVGRDRFRALLTGILARHEHGALSAAEFVREVSAGAGRELGWFYRQWFLRPGVPHWTLTWTQEGATLRGVITQPPPYYRATIPVVASSVDGEARARRVQVEGARTEFAWPLPFAALHAELDPHRRLLRWSAETRARADALVPVTRALARDSIDGLRGALTHVPEPDVVAYAFTTHLGLAGLLLDRGMADSARRHAEAALVSPTRDAELLSLAYARLALAAQQTGDLAAFQRGVRGAVAADSAAGVAGASIWVQHLKAPTLPPAP